MWWAFVPIGFIIDRFTSENCLVGNHLPDNAVNEHRHPEIQRNRHKGRYLTRGTRVEALQRFENLVDSTERPITQTHHHDSKQIRAQNVPGK